MLPYSLPSGRYESSILDYPNSSPLLSYPPNSSISEFSVVSKTFPPKAPTLEISVPLDSKNYITTPPDHPLQEMLQRSNLSLTEFTNFSFPSRPSFHLGDITFDIGPMKDIVRKINLASSFEDTSFKMDSFADDTEYTLEGVCFTCV